MRKNVAGQIVGAQMASATDGSAFTGSVTAYITLDGGTQAVGSVGSGACTHEGNGYHTYAPSQAETNGNLVAVTFIGTGAIPATVQIYTVGYDPTVAALPANVTQFGGTNGTFSGGRPEVNTTHAAGTAWGSGAITAASISTDAITAAKIAANAIDAATFAADVDAEVRGWLGLASANLDTQLSTIDTEVGVIDGIVDAILVDTGTTLQAELDGIQADTEDIQSRLPAALVSGRMDASVGAMASGVLTATAIAADAITAAKVAADVTTEFQSGLATAAALATVDTVVDAILADTGTDGVIVATNNDKTGYAIGTGGIAAAAFDAGAIDAAALNASAVDEILDEQVGDGTLTMRQVLRVMTAALAGKLSGAATTTVTIRNVADTANVIVATVDADGNRSATTVSP